MEITSSPAKYGKNAVPHRFAAVATAWIVLGSSGGNVCAQSGFNQNRVIIPGFETGSVRSMSGIETSLMPTNPPAIFKQQFIAKADWRETASESPIIPDPAIVQLDPALIHTVRAVSITSYDDGAFEKVTVTDGWTPALPHPPTSVTLWDEIAPPVRAPIPANAIVHSTPDDVADAEVRTTQ